jgi:hypothetical protein
VETAPETRASGSTPDQTHAVLDTYVPIGNNSLTVDDDHDLKAGDRVIVQWTMSPAFIPMIGMDQIPSRKDGRTVIQRPTSMGLDLIGGPWP